MWKIKRPEDEAPAVEADTSVPASPVKEADSSILYPQPTARSDSLQKIRMAIHQSLLDKINLSLLDKLPEEQIKAEITAWTAGTVSAIARLLVPGGARK